MIITLTMNPAIDKTAEVKKLEVGGLNRIENVLMDAGGKGINVSKTMASLKEKSIAFGLLAGNSGLFIKNELDKLHIEHHFLMIEGNTRTNLKVLDQDKVLTELNECGPSPKEEELNLLSEQIASALSENDVFVISGSVPANVDKDYYQQLINIAHTKKAKVILDADGDLFKEGIKAKPTIIKPNRYELCQYFNISEDISEQEMIALARNLIHRGIEIVAISMGSEGALFVSEKQAIHVDALKIEAHSSVGAGDAMVAAMAYSLVHEYNLEKMVKLAVATSAGAVMSKGTNPPSKKLVEKLMEEVIIRYL
ncbi:MAG: 1-phosphofructokinase [Erysipelotrichia bacterium]|nr:1-phosphofructokinase [Erysipelotrichia bacterium]NCC54607.1 1-phosphofructokinase [Erysipelotrichia bacterium]